jgi:putative peptidoglycan lipid II flippase
VILTTALGFAMALGLPKLLGIDLHWGGAALTASFGIAGWVEFTLLRRGMNQRIGDTGLPGLIVRKALVLAPRLRRRRAWLKVAFPGLHRILAAVVVLGGFGLVYLGAAMLIKGPGIANPRSATASIALRVCDGRAGVELRVNLISQRLERPRANADTRGRRRGFRDGHGAA